ncbi:MAG: hypothetical protein MUC74_08700 [Ideonella sp.]|nr:hypothetical protein [Ideonella sp.]
MLALGSTDRPSSTVQAVAPAVLDLEASGFGRASYPIEVGFALPDGVLGCTLIRPEPSWIHWDPAAEHLHGIRRATALRAGRPTAEVARWLNGHLAGLVVYCDGWAHDYPWLGMLFDAAGQRPAFRLEHLHRLLDDARLSRWDDTVEAVRRDLGGARHRASTDARVLQVALQRLGA